MAVAVYTSKSNQWREYLNPLRGLTIERIVQYIEQGERGAFADLQWFYQAMERSDALIATVVQRRRAALMSCDWRAEPEERPSDAVLAREQAAVLQDCYDRIGNLREAIAFLGTAVFRGFAHVEKQYDASGAVTGLIPVEQWFWVRKGMFGEFCYNRDARSCVDEGEKVNRENFLFIEFPMALDRILSVQYFRRNLCQRDWDSYLEVYGIPSVFFVGPPNVTEEKEKEYLAVAETLIKDGRGYLPNGTDVKYVDGGGGGRPPFRDHLDYIDRQIVLLGTGGLLTVLAESGSGTLAGGAHSEAFRQVVASDAVAVTEAFRRDFDRAELEKAFPGWPVEAGFKLGADVVDGPEPVGAAGDGVEFAVTSGPSAA